jgi:hypothetical protein
MSIVYDIREWIQIIQAYREIGGSDLMNPSDWEKFINRFCKDTIFGTLFGPIELPEVVELYELPIIYCEIDLTLDTFYDLLWPIIDIDISYLSLFKNVFKINISNIITSNKLNESNRYYKTREPFNDIYKLINLILRNPDKYLNFEINELLVFIFDFILKITNELNISPYTKNQIFNYIISTGIRDIHIPIDLYILFKALPYEFRTNYEFIREIIYYSNYLYHRQDIEEIVFKILNASGMIDNPDFILVNLMMPVSRSNGSVSDYSRWNNIVIIMKALKLDTRPESLLYNRKFLLDASCLYSTMFGGTYTIDSIMREFKPELYSELESHKEYVTSIIHRIRKSNDKERKLLQSELLSFIKENGRALEWCSLYKQSPEYIEAASYSSPWAAAAYFSNGYNLSRLSPVLLEKLIKLDWRVGMWLYEYDRNDFEIMSRMIRYSANIYDFESIVKKTYSSIPKFNNLPTPLLTLIISFTY